MSFSFSLTRAGDQPGTFTIRTIDRCWAVYGEISAENFSRLAKGFSANALLDVNLAHRLGAVAVMGEPEDLAALRARKDLPLSPARAAEQAQAANTGLPEAVVKWLADGERGASSEALCRAIYGVPSDAGDDYPGDSWDMKRCIDFADSTGSKHLLFRAKMISPRWARIVDHWDELSEMILAAHSGYSKTATSLLRKLTYTD